jgi:uncharacterized protein YdeI (YjbR/CyaY-like superfamily)
LENPRFFNSAKLFREWLQKNYKKPQEIWLGFYKKGYDKTALTYIEALDIAMCFGWTGNVIKGMDQFSYKVKFLPRRPKSIWSHDNIKKFHELNKKGLVKKAGLEAFEKRDKGKSQEKVPELTSKLIKRFKANKKAWEFFSHQTKSYQKYMAWWVISAKQESTQLKRLDMLIEDSANGSKLRRVVEAVNKIEARKQDHPPGETPIEHARNIGPVCGSELRSIGISTVEKLQSVGWEDVFCQICEKYPNRLNLNMAVGLAAAVENQDWKKISPNLKARAKLLLLQLKRDFKSDRY